jgi:hypothetical protein
MITISCQNKYIDKRDELRTCGRFLGAISDRVALALKEFPEEKIVFRCPQCSNTKFVAIHGDDEGRLVQETLTETRIDGGYGVDEVLNTEQLY